MKAKARLADQEVEEHESILEVAFGSRNLANGGESECGPIEAVDVLMPQGVDGFVAKTTLIVHPTIGVEADEKRNGKVDASIPVDQDQNVEDKLGDAENVWIVGTRFGALEELGNAIEAQQTIHAKDHRTRVKVLRLAMQAENNQNNYIDGHDGENVQLETHAANIIDSQTVEIAHQKTLVEITGPATYEHVQQIYYIHHIVADGPQSEIIVLHLPEHCSPDYCDQVVDHTRASNHFKSFSS